MSKSVQTPRAVEGLLCVKNLSHGPTEVLSRSEGCMQSEEHFPKLTLWAESKATNDRFANLKDERELLCSTAFSTSAP